MASLPFGFGGMSGQKQALTPQQKRKQGTKQLARQINFGMANSPMGSGGMGAMMGFMGLPFMSKGNGAGKGSGGPWMTVDPVSQTIFQGGFSGLGGDGGGMGGGGGGGGPQIEDPPLPPLDPDDPNGNGGTDIQRLLELLKPPPIGTGAQWRNTMKYGA